MHIYNSMAFMMPFFITCVVWVFARTEIMRELGEPFWKGLIPGMAECEIAADFGFDPKRCIAIMLFSIFGIVLFLINTLPTFIAGCVCFAIYMVLFFPVADDLAYAVGRNRFFAFLLTVVPPVGFALIAWVPSFKLEGSDI